MPPCTNNLTTALLMDTYQITMAYAYWKNGTHERPAAFDLLFRKTPSAASSPCSPPRGVFEVREQLRVHGG